MEKVAEEQGLALQKIQTDLLFNASGLKLGYYGIFDMLFPFLAFF